jgi:outer membrane receptor protein involved in Fe transport
MTWMKKKWIVGFGLRFDAFKFEYMDKTSDVFITDSKYEQLLSPKLNIALNATENLQIYLKLGQGFHSNDARVVTRNDSLATLPRAFGADLGINWKPVPKLIINAALWYMYLESELVWSGDAGTWEPSGKTNRLGVDLSLRWQIVNGLFFDTDINYGIARFIDEPEGANYVPLAPVWTSTGGLTLNHPRGWSSSFRYRLMSDRPADETNEVTALGYGIFDFKLNYTLRKWTFGVSFENLFNSDWNDAQFAGEYRVTGTAEPDYGLTYTAGIPFFFKGNVCFRF